MNGRVFVVTAAVGAALALGLTAFLLLRKAPPTIDDMGPHPFGDPTVLVTDADRAALGILNGAEKARRKRMPETALRFYEDVDLRFSHTNVYARYHEEIWDEMKKCHEAAGVGAGGLPAFVQARRDLQKRWRALQDGPRPKPALEAFLKDLPPGDGRRPQVETWLQR